MLLVRHVQSLSEIDPDIVTRMVLDLQTNIIILPYDPYLFSNKHLIKYFRILITPPLFFFQHYVLLLLVLFLLCFWKPYIFETSRSVVRNYNTTIKSLTFTDSIANIYFLNLSIIDTGWDRDWNLSSCIGYNHYINVNLIIMQIQWSTTAS